MTTVRPFAALCFSTALSASLTSLTVAAGQRTNEDPLAELGAYRETLSALDLNDLDSVRAALRQFESRFGNRPVEELDGAFLALREFFYEVEDKQHRIVARRDSEVRNDQAYKISLGENGFRLLMTEGDWYVDEQPDFLYEKFGERVSEAIRVFLLLRVKEKRERFAEDAALMISFEDLAGRIRSWDQYLAQYPDSPLRDAVEYFYTTYLYVLLDGLDNSLAFDVEPESGQQFRRLRPSVRQVYKNYVENNPGTKSGIMVKEYYALLDKNGFQRSDEVVAFLRKRFQPLWKKPAPPSW